MKTILVPTDFSETADNALSYAIGFAAQSSAQVILLHAFNVGYSASYIPYALIEDEIDAIHKESFRKLKELTSKFDYNNIRCISVEDLAVDAILRIGREKEADLIIMGTKGVTNLANVILGSNASAIVRRADRPVLVIPADARFHNFRHIVCATNCENEEIPGLQSLMDICKPLETKITFVHIMKTEKEDYQTVMNSFIQKLKEQTGYNYIQGKVLPPGNVHVQLEAYCESLGAELLVMSARHHDFLEKIVHRSQTKKMSLYSKIPLLVLHADVEENIIAS